MFQIMDKSVEKLPDQNLEPSKLTWTAPPRSLMNLELFTLAAARTGNATYRQMAESHANKTLTNNIRQDFDSFHVVNYDPETGDVQWRGTAQGALHERSSVAV